jgi:hypothetical protein
MFHNFTKLSMEFDRRVVPSGETARDVIES